MPLVGGVIVVGPHNIRLWSRTTGAVAVSADLVEAALAGIDDELTLLNDEAVAVADIWRELFETLAADIEGPVALVFPSWWPAERIAVVHSAARTVGLEILQRSRSVVLAQTMARKQAIVIEIAEDLVAVSSGGARPIWAESYQCDELTPTAAAVAQTVNSLRFEDATVIVDCGTSDADALGLAEAVTQQLGPCRATIGGDDRVLQAAARTHVDGPRVPRSIRDEPRRVVPARRLAIAAGAVIALVVTAALPRDGGPGAAEATTLLVEGRVVVEVPAAWHVQRIVDGPGSPRLQVTSPSDPEAAVHVTQSLVPVAETLSATADTLRGALAREPPGVFVDFNGHDRRGGREAVTYREIRRDHEVAWTVLLEGALRIAVGCQTARGREEAVRITCERAVVSVRDIRKSTGTDSVSRQSNST